ncbi:MAG TPA: hypothetical protein VFU14_10945 [Acidimicrobiales bacterium]|nr:hypothetical protein [Acidimicrobiales bacterium]
MNTPSYGLWLLLGVVFAPVYLTLAGWALGQPRQLRLPLVGAGFLVGLTAVAWGGVAVLAYLLHLTFG